MQIFAKRKATEADRRAVTKLALNRRAKDDEGVGLI
jgi:hypothetical protein